MFRFAIQRGIILSVAITMLCLFGLIAIVRVPVQMTPDIDKPIISVRTLWPGASPQEIESEILIEQEKFLRRLQGLLKMTAEAKTGEATIDLEFAVGSDVQALLVRVNNALSQVARYPENVDPPSLVTSASSQEAFIFYTLESLNPERFQPGPAELTRILDQQVANRLERIAGVSELIVYGKAEQQVQLRVDPQKLAARRISLAELRTALRSRNRDTSGGDINSGKRRYVIRTPGRFQSLEDIADTVIAERNGQSVRVRDIGTVSMGSEEQRSRGYINGKPSFTFGVVRSPGGNVIEILDDLTTAVARLNRDVLRAEGLQIVKYSDDVRYVKDAIAVVQKNLAVGGLLAALMLFLFLRRAAPTLLGTLGVPICAVGAFFGLLLAGRTLNVISLAGIAFAIGMTLDNSIVVLENIFRHRAKGKTAFAAALEGVSEVWTAVLASTLTTVFVFAPILFIDHEVGQLYSDIAIAISAAIIFSMLVAVTIIPSVAARFQGEKKQAVDRLPRITALATGFQARVLSTVDWILQSTRRQLAVVLATLGCALLVMLTLLPSAEYLPEGEESKIFALMIPPPGYNIDEIDRASQSLEALLLPQLNADGSAYARGDTPVPPMKYLLRGAFGGIMFSISEPLDNDPEHARALQQALTEYMRDQPGMIGIANRGSIFSDNSGGSRSIQINIVGSDLVELYAAAMQAFLKSREVFANAQIRPLPGLSLAQPTLEVRPDWQRASELGISAEELGYAVWALSDGAYLDDYFLDDSNIDIYVYGATGRLSSPEHIAQQPIYTPHGGVVPISAVAEVVETVGADQLRRVDGRRVVSLNLVPPPDIALEDAVATVQAEIVDTLMADQGFRQRAQIELAGASDKLHSARQALLGNVIIAIVLAYLLMVAIFSHWGFPLLVVLNLPLGISGGIFGLWLMNNVFGVAVKLDMITLLGMVVLIGTVVNNPILLVEKTRQLLAEGMTVAEAVVQSVSIRLRPIMMSMLTTVFGLSPVVFLAGAGTELYRGLGTIVLFGLLFSTLVTITFMPALLALVLNVINKRAA